MGSNISCNSERDVSAAGTSRRQLLTAGGLLAVGALGGCLRRVAGATTSTRASPAAPFGGIGEHTGPSPVGEPAVYKLTPTVSTDLGDVELEAWVTAQAIATEDYNSPRSNRSIRAPDDPDSDGDGLDDTVELRSKTLELEQQLLTQTQAASDSISKRSARTGRRGLADMGGSIRDVQTMLDRCSDDVCVTVRDHADHREKLTQQAAEYVENGEWEAASENVRTIQEIVEGDIELLESSLNDANASKEPLSNPRLQELTGASAEDITALYEYLAGEPVISEQFTITVPDARVPGRDLALVDELTPRRIIEYVTGRADEEGKLYAWGQNRSGGQDSGGDRSNPLYEGESVGGESAMYRGDLLSNGGGGEGSPLHSSDALSSYVSGPFDTGRHLEVVVAAGNVTVLPVNDPPQAAERTPAITVSVDGESVSPRGFDDWELLDQPNETTSALVCPIMVAPPDCPSPFPALLYVRRCKNADQYIYTGGWVIDDGSLYRDSITLVAVGEPTAVIGVGAGDLDGDGYGDVMARRLSGERERRGARLFDGAVSDAVAEGHLSEAEGEDIILRKRPGRTTRQEEGTAADVPVTMTAQGRLVHFTGASASDDVKFKAGAELSKSVN